MKETTKKELIGRSVLVVALVAVGISGTGLLLSYPILTIFGNTPRLVSNAYGASDSVFGDTVPSTNADDNNDNPKDDSWLTPAFAQMYRVLKPDSFCVSFYGFTKAEALGRLSHELLRTVFPEPFAVVDTTLGREGRWSGELRHTTRDGRDVLVESRWQVIDLDGREVVLEVVRDITARKHAEVELRAAMEQLHLVTDAMAVPVTRCDADHSGKDNEQAISGFAGLVHTLAVRVAASRTEAAYTIDLLSGEQRKSLCPPGL